MKIWYLQWNGYDNTPYACTRGGTAISEDSLEDLEVEVWLTYAEAWKDASSCLGRDYLSGGPSNWELVEIDV